MNSASVAVVPSALVVDDEPVLSGTVKNYRAAGMSAQTCVAGTGWPLDLGPAVVLTWARRAWTGWRCAAAAHFSDCWACWMSRPAPTRSTS